MAYRRSEGPNLASSIQHALLDIVVSMRRSYYQSHVHSEQQNTFSKDFLDFTEFSNLYTYGHWS